MSVTWILVANARHARLFSLEGPNKAFALVREERLEEEAAKPARHADGRASPRRRTPGANAARQFAQHLAEDLCRGRNTGAYARAVLVAPPSFLGLLNAELDAPTASLVSGRVDKDYTRANEAQLRAELGQCLCV